MSKVGGWKSEGVPTLRVAGHVLPGAALEAHDCSVCICSLHHWDTRTQELDFMILAGPFQFGYSMTVSPLVLTRVVQELWFVFSGTRGCNNRAASCPAVPRHLEFLPRVCMLSRFPSPLAESLGKESECKAFPYPGHQAQSRVGVHVPTAPSLQLPLAGPQRRLSQEAAHSMSSHCLI